MKKWDTVDEVHKSIDIPEAPKKDAQSSGHIPLPPPPPPGGNLPGVAALSNLMKPFSKSTQRSESPDSSVYSPGTYLLLNYVKYLFFTNSIRTLSNKKFLLSIRWISTRPKKEPTSSTGQTRFSAATRDVKEKH